MQLTAGAMIIDTPYINYFISYFLLNGDKELQSKSAVFLYRSTLLKVLILTILFQSTYSVQSCLEPCMGTQPRENF